MSGYKQAVLDLNPKFFLTFDGDPFDPINRTITAIPNQFVDETGNGNNGLLHYDGSGQPSYRMGTASLITLEPSDQYSIEFAPASPQASGTIYPKAYIEVPNSADFGFTTHNGSFSVTMTVKKMNSDLEFWSRYHTNPKRILIQKGTAFSVYLVNNFGDNQYIYAMLPDGSTIWATVRSSFYAKPHQITFVWDVKPGDTSLWTATASLYIDAHLYASKVINYFDAYPNTNNTTSFEILGQAAASPSNMSEDRQTSPIYLDQVACFDFSLTGDQVAFLHKKTLGYDSLITYDDPVYFAPMNEVYSTTGGLISATVNSYGLTGTYHGLSPAQIVDRVPGPSNIPGRVGRGFQSGGTATITNGSYISPVINTTGEMTVEFWAQLNATPIATVFSMTEGSAPYRGLKLEINKLNGAFTAGCLQFSGSELINCVAPGSWNDGNWHHIAMVIRSPGNMELWVDGVKLGTNTYPGWGGIGAPGQIYLMGDTGGNECPGSMCNLAIYQYALNAQEIRARFAYAIIYKIQGTVTLAALPYAANLRLYRHSTGEKIQEIVSDAGTGDYLFKLLDGGLVDLVALNMQDSNVRYRVYGPITPSQYPDL